MILTANSSNCQVFYTGRFYIEKKRKKLNFSLADWQSDLVFSVYE